jgi:hypothetical protein
VDPYEPPRHKIEDHKNFTDYFEQVPVTGWLTLNSKEKEACEEVVALNEEEKSRPHLSKRGFVRTFSKINNLRDRLAPDGVDNCLDHFIVVFLLH